MRQVLKTLIFMVLISSFSIISARSCSISCGRRGPCCSSSCCFDCCDPCCGDNSCNNSCYGSCCGTCGNDCCGTCCDSDCDDCCKASACGYPFLAYRSQSWNAARQIVGIQPFINRYDMDKYYGNFAITMEYTRSMRPHRITQFLFGRDTTECNSILIQGGLLPNRSPKAWLADYFGLPCDFNSRVSFHPTIENFMVDLDFYLGLDEFKEGMYFRVYAPLTWTRWKLRMCECVKDFGECYFDRGYMSADQVLLDELPTNFTEAISGCTTWGDMQSPLRYGRMTSCPMTMTRLSDIQLVYGWNFVRDCDYHFGLNIRMGIPTGNRPCARYLFEPIIGNGKHWELGGGLTSKYIFWRSEENEDDYWGVYLDANIAHLFRTNQCRSFDFCGCNNSGSRYMLLAQMGTNQNTLQGGPDIQNLTEADYQYKRKLIPAIHYTTYNVEVSIAVQADIVLKFGYNHDNWSCDFGYNLWARSGEKFCFTDCCCCGCESDGVYAIKGDAALYGYTGTNNTDAVPLSSSQAGATIRSVQNIREETLEETFRNKGSDNSQLAWTDGQALTIYEEPFVQLYTSIQPNLVSCNHVNFCNSPSALSHKLFAHFSYTWAEREDCWTPYLGFGGEAEFDGNCNTCRFAVSQWGMWLKGGIAFE